MLTPWYGFRVTLTPDEVLAELRTIRTEQQGMDPTSDEYQLLESRRLELVSMAQMALDTSHGRESLVRELANLQQRLEHIDNHKIEVPAWQQAMASRRGLTINDPAAHASQINAAHDRNTAADRSAIEARISQLRKILAE